MWLQPVTRRELVDILTPRKGYAAPDAVEEHRFSLDVIRPDYMGVVWPIRPEEFGQIPTAIIVPDGTHRDTLAWLATYVRDFKPFTAFCRVVERSLADRLLAQPRIPKVQGIEGIYSGLVLGEALAQSRGASAIFDLPTTAYTATLSHAIGRTIALVGPSFPLDLIARLWAQTREATGQPALPVPHGAIQTIWTMALGLSKQWISERSLFDSGNLIAVAWSDYSEVGDIRDLVWMRLIEGLHDLEPLRILTSLPREQRVEGVELALHLLLTARQQPDDRRAFLAGYFTSLLTPGTLNLAELLAPLAASLPMAYIWYGLFAGTTTKGDALPSGNPLARRLVRDLSVPDRLVDRPRCDVAIEELVMFPGGDNLVKLTGKAGRLDIDILPGVTTSVRWPAHTAALEDEQHREREVESRHLLVEMEELAMRQRTLVDRLREVLSSSADKRSTTPSKRPRPKRS